MNYSSVPKEDFLYPDRPTTRDAQPHETTAHKKGWKCCCCRCTTKRFFKICCAATLGPILLLGLIIGIYLLVQRLSYNPPPSQISTTNDTMAFLSELAELSASPQNSTNQTETRVLPQFELLTKVLPPWTNCGTASDLAKPRVVSIEHCQMEDGRCVFVTEIDWMLEVAFTTKPNVTIVEPTFHACGKAIYLGTPCRTQPFSRPFPCNDSNIECPLKGNTNYLYRNIGGIHAKDLPVKILWDTYADVFFRMKDPKTNKNVFCIRIPAIIKPAQTPA